MLPSCFADLGGYLQRRYLEQGWSVKRMRAELGVGRNWLVAQMARAVMPADRLGRGCQGRCLEVDGAGAHAAARR
jgi:hypothetical protein